MGGTLELSSDGIGCGTLARVVLPLVTLHPDVRYEMAQTTVPVLAQDEEPAPALPSVARVKRVLLVDDTALNLTVMKRAILALGIEVVTAENGEEAKLQCRDSGPFDMILMDIFMPVLGGIEAARQIRAMRLVDASVPIIALTAAATQSLEDECREAGMNAMVTKPVSQAALREMLLK